MINILNKSDCCGCNACADACCKGAITFRTDQEGFWYPVVNESLCNNCGLCEKACPMLSVNNTNKNESNPKCYAATHKSMEVVFSSTTGGMFSALAESMYAQGGYVGGAIHNDDFSVSHYISNDKNDLKALRRSKDLQSNAEGFYSKVRELLCAGESVLVCGVPCQIAGLKSFLQREYDNLITVDLVCAGVNSPKVWRKYLDYIERINDSKIVYTENKSKEYGWKKLTQKFVFENGNEYFDTKDTSLFIKGFVDSHFYCRPSCYDCKFKGFPRVADISIGDFWGIEKKDPKYNNDMGTSLLMINSSKGETYFNYIKKRIVFEEKPLGWALEGNKALVYSMTKSLNNREVFFDDLEKMPFDSVVKKHSVEKKESVIDRLRCIKKQVKFVKFFLDMTQYSPKAIYQSIKYSGLRNLLNRNGIICCKNSVINIHKTSNIEFKGLLVLGRKGKFKHSKDESKLFVGKGAKLSVLGDFEIDANCEIVIFDNAELVIEGKKHLPSDANSGLRIICGQKIEIMADVGIGRNVSIRDTNGNAHFINTTGYRPSRPVVIGEKAWLCESCTIMPGVKVGRGAIVGVNSTVTKSVPNHALVSGFPAEVVQENVIFKL